MSSVTAPRYARPFAVPARLPGAPQASRPAAPAPGTSGVSSWQPKATTVPGRPPARAAATAAPSARPQGAANADLKLDLFARTDGWKPFYTGARHGDPNAGDAPFAQRVSQRLLVAKGDPSLGPDGAIYTETHAVVRATPEQVLTQLRDPHFWDNGSVDHWTAKPDGSFTYALWPAGKLAGVKVNETMHPPVRLPDGSYVVRIDLSRKGDGRQLMPGQAQGLAYILVKPRGDGSTDVYGRFAGVQEFNPLFNAEQFAKNHLLGERGELKAGESFINHLLPNGTGFGAMLRRAETSGAR